jgi:hypothetical protein
MLNFEGAVNPLERRGPTVIHRDRYQSPMQTDQIKDWLGFRLCVDPI